MLANLQRISCIQTRATSISHFSSIFLAKYVRFTKALLMSQIYIQLLVEMMFRRQQTSGVFNASRFHIRCKHILVDKICCRDIGNFIYCDHYGYEVIYREKQQNSLFE